MFRINLCPFRKSTLKRTEMEFERLAKIAGAHPDKMRFNLHPDGWFVAEIPASTNARTQHAMLNALAKRENNLLSTTDKNDPCIAIALDYMNEHGLRKVAPALDSQTASTLYVLGAVSAKTLRDIERVAYDTVIKRCAKLRMRDLTHAYTHGVFPLKPEEAIANPEINRLLSLLARDEKWERAHAHFRTASPMRNADRISGYYEAIHRYNLEDRLKKNSGTPTQSPSA